MPAMVGYLNHWATDWVETRDCSCRVTMTSQEFSPLFHRFALKTNTRSGVANQNDLARHFGRTLQSRGPHIKIYIFLLDLDPLQTYVGVKT
ncbi:hypothetical protein TNCV_4275431 [Trichonephila clavipes]|nr:hypothetical protein TNCV_4275431 [Trichonephila clavipes]